MHMTWICYSMYCIIDSSLSSNCSVIRTTIDMTTFHTALMAIIDEYMHGPTCVGLRYLTLPPTVNCFRGAYFELLPAGGSWLTNISVRPAVIFFLCSFRNPKNPSSRVVSCLWSHSSVCRVTWCASFVCRVSNELTVYVTRHHGA